jgi:serine/threonine protein kinase
MDGIPSVLGLYDHGPSQYLVMSEMGPSIENLFRRCGNKFSLKTVLMLADQMLRIIQWVHAGGMLHRDIKPQNFLIGCGDFKNKVYLIDFGASVPYLDPKSRQHVSSTREQVLVGTINYMSINTAQGERQSRRDDIESLIYLLLRFLQGSLPWEGIKVKNKEERRKRVAEAKIQMSIDTLCENVPHEFKQILEAIRRLNFDEKPRYAWCRQVFTQLFLREGFVYDGVFDWDERAPIHPPAPMLFLIRSAVRYLGGNPQNSKQGRLRPPLPRPQSLFMADGPAFW